MNDEPKPIAEDEMQDLNKLTSLIGRMLADR